MPAPARAAPEPPAPPDAAAATLEPPARPGLVLLCLLALYVIWGSTYLGMRFALESFAPFTMAGLRFLFAGSVLLMALKVRGHALPTRRQWGASALTGFLLLTVGNGAVAVGEQTLPSGIAAVVVGSMPLWAALFSGLWGQWPGTAERWGLLLGFAGIVLLNAGGGLSGSALGAVALLVAPAAWAFGSVWSRRLPLPPGLMATAAQMLCGGAAALLLSRVLREPWPLSPTPRALGSFLYLVVFGSLVAFSAYGYLLRNARPALATSYAYVNPAIAVLLGVLFAGERLGPWTVVAMGIILAAVLLLTRARVRAATAAARR
ncbi:drug/metabolite exporter YedA [Aggregicoccus sp. 17bor-14]|uniref:drug/metabolite exporter YedA n=1 Tax=Myxococcaceae TaxID=31 RepID=UPI00129C34D0|nr:MULTISPECIES: drug/metabolite exporter YedA [Myxococcaceae]MBF5041729.1 drug/metabolite exporter YedA [Simulacricoccus sp. 17bor-14]MRI87510.1 drug/metabolite exporter YedA [Aggregicoccus sp. 17bor-14]